MSRLRFAILLAVAAGVLLLPASASSSPSSSRPPEVYSVGDETGLAAPPGNDDDGTQQTLSKWAMTQSFYVGDVLDFKSWSDSVLLVRQGDYERCSAASPVRRLFADGGDTQFTLARPGLFYFISGAPARCEAGQRMVVLVRVADPLNKIISAAPTPTPAPAPAPAATLSKRSRRPLTIAQMQMVAGALGFATGFIAMFLIVGLFICYGP